MKNCVTYLSIITISCLFLFLSGCERGAAVQSGTGKDKTRPINKPGVSEAETGQKIGAKILFENTLHNFGDVLPDSWNICEFKFKNAGDDILRVGTIKATCGCTAATLTKDVYEPGEEGVIRVKYHGDQQAGSKSKHLYVPSNDKEQPKVVLTIDANIVYKVTWEPEKLDLLLDRGNAGCPEVILRSRDGKPFAIKGVHCSRNCITADYDPSVEATEFVVKPRVDTNILAEYSTGEIDFVLSHPECKRVKISYRARPFFVFRPPSVVIFDAEAQKPVTKDVWLSSSYATDYEIESTSAQKDCIKVLEKEKIDNRYKLVLEITPPAVGTGKRMFTDMLNVVMKNGREAKLICRGFYKRDDK